MSDDLLLPQVPDAKPEDPEDVSWALSTAEAMWARGDHAEGIKWVRRAAEAASEAENDLRALELAKAAADLTGLIARRASRASIDIEEIVAEPDQAPPPIPRAPPVPRSSSAPGPIVKPIQSAPKQGSTPSRPPAPLPSRTSQLPGARPAKPLGTNTTKPPSMRPSAPPRGDKKDAKKARRSRENLDAEAAAAGEITARQGAVDEAAAQKALSNTGETAAVQVPNMGERLRRRSDDPTAVSNVNDIVDASTSAIPRSGAPPAFGAASTSAIPRSSPSPTFGGASTSAIPRSSPSPTFGGASTSTKNDRSSADAWDASPTQNLAGEELPFPHFPHVGDDGDRKTAVGVASQLPDSKPALHAFPQQHSGSSGSPPAAAFVSGPPATVAGTAMMHGPSSVGAPHQVGGGSVRRGELGERHDPAIVTSQAVRVVVWRDGAGVHVAPAGTVVSAITVEAVLVALEPNADLTAWLSDRAAPPPAKSKSKS